MADQKCSTNNLSFLSYNYQVVVSVCGSNRNVIGLTPAYNITKDTADQIVSKFKEALTEISKESSLAAAAAAEAVRPAAAPAAPSPTSSTASREVGEGVEPGRRMGRKRPHHKSDHSGDEGLRTSDHHHTNASKRVKTETL